MAFRLRPVEHGFFPLFTRAGENIQVATHALALMVAAEPGARAGLARRVKDAELAGDGLTREILVKLNSTFVTPFDREDIYRLTAALDDVVDAIEEAANRIVLYRLAELPPGVSAQVDVLCRAAEVTAEAMPQLNDVGKLDGFTTEVNALEDEADAIHHDLLGTLLAPGGDLAPADVLRIITLKEVVDTLEDAADAFETVANTVESIAVKES
jgi:predicted phosphate transport protein (TIGR00153 family)